VIKKQNKPHSDKLSRLIILMGRLFLISNFSALKSASDLFFGAQFPDLDLVRRKNRDFNPKKRDFNQK